MILQALYELAEREQLGGDYRTEVVDLLAHIDADGHLIALVPTAGEDGRSRRMSVPLRLKRSGKRPPPYFLVDNALYVLGIAGVDSDGEERKSEEDVIERTESFRRFLAEVCGEDSDPGLLAARRFCEQLVRNRAIAQELLPEKEWTGSEWVALVLQGDDAEAIHLRPVARAAWQRHRARATDAGGTLGTCLITGTFGLIARLHDMPIKGLASVGGTPSGTALVSFNASAFESNGLKQAGNAPTSASAAEAYIAALNFLLDRPPGRTRPHRYGIALRDAVLLIWSREPVQEIETLLDLLSGDRVDARNVEAVVLAPWRGVKSDADVTPFYGLTLSAAQARAFVRSWFTTTLGEVKANVLAWFDALAVGDDASPLPMWQLLAALDPPGDARTPPVLASRLATAALFGGPLPREAMRHALMRFRVPSDAKRRHEARARIALIKAVLIRTYQKEVTVSLDLQCRDQAYLLGRLFAVLERLQAAALNDLNATIRDRYFGAASSTPSTVFPRLIRLSVHHAAKANAGWLEKLKGQVIDALPARKFPGVLDLEQQGLFAVGYYHQREAFFQKRSDEGSSSHPEN